LGINPGVSAVYVETIRDGISEPNWVPVIASLPTLSEAARQKALSDMRTEYARWLYGIAAHEIGHYPGRQSPNSDHAEDALMKDGNGAITTPFSPATLRRFRRTESWSK
jgi:hypothetical protein